MKTNVATPQAATTAWVAQTAAKANNWKDGCASTSADPFRRALEKAPEAIERYTVAVSPGGSWYNFMSTAPKSIWTNGCATAAKNGRYASGCRDKQAKYQAFATRAQEAWKAMQNASRNSQGWQQKMTAAVQALIDASAGGKLRGSAVAG